MPLPPSSYHLSSSHLRLDGRRWNELRRIHAQISTQASADGSSYLEMGNTKVLCTVSGPQEIKAGGRRGGGGDEDRMGVDVRVGVGMERRRGGGGGGRGDRRITSLQNTISSAFSSVLFTHLYPHSTITLSIHILSLDGSLLAASLNAATLALIDAGVPMKDYLVACTAGLTPPAGGLGRGGGGGGGREGGEDDVDPLLDLNGVEEVEVPFLTVGTVGAGERVSVCVMESRVRVERVEGMLAVGVDGCKQVREVLDGVVRERGRRVLGFGKGGRGG